MIERRKQLHPSEVAQDEAGPMTNNWDGERTIGKKGEVMFRILSLSMLSDETESQSPSVDTSSDIRLLPKFGDKANAGAVPTPLEHRDDKSSIEKQSSS